MDGTDEIVLPKGAKLLKEDEITLPKGATLLKDEEPKKKV